MNLRVYRAGPDDPAPIAVFFHGGAFVTGDCDTCDHLCRRIALDSGRVVFSIDYRLAPEHRFPAAVEDAYAALHWVAGHGSRWGGDTGRIAVVGESAGGTLAAVVCQLARDAGTPTIDRQVLIYPGTDSSRTYPSEIEFSTAPILSKADIDWGLDHYLSSEQERLDPRMSPLLGSLERLPPALVIAAEYDPLRDEAEAYATALREAGNRVEYRLFRHQPHGFVSLGILSSRARHAQREIATFLRI